MTKSRTDRRIRRSRELLHRALIELILEKGYDRTTVQDILDRADVGRSTFYSHYHSKDQLLLSGMDDLRGTLDTQLSTASEGQEPQSLMAPLRPLFEHAADNRHLYRALLGSRATSLAVRAGRRMLSQLLTGHLRAQLTIDDEDRLDLAVAFLINGLLATITWWLDSRPELPPDEIFAHFERLTMGVDAFLS